MPACDEELGGGTVIDSIFPDIVRDSCQFAPLMGKREMIKQAKTKKVVAGARARRFLFMVIKVTLQQDCALRC